VNPSAPPPEPSPPGSRTPLPSRTTALGSDVEVIRSAPDDLKRFLAGKADLRTVIAAVETAIPVLEAAQTEGAGGPWRAANPRRTSCPSLSACLEVVVPFPAVDPAAAAVDYFLVGVTGLAPRDVALRDGNQS
jgi:hypothetical protein